MQSKGSSMKKPAFTILFTGIQIFLVFFYIHHRSLLIQLSYQKQKYEKRKAHLNQKTLELKQELHATHDLARIKNFALQSHMKKITLDQIKAVPNEHTAI